jgi:hypothetical protein
MCAQVAARAELDVNLHACAPSLLEREEAAILLQQKLTKAIRPCTPCHAAHAHAYTYTFTHAGRTRGPDSAPMCPLAMWGWAVHWAARWPLHGDGGTEIGGVFVCVCVCVCLCVCRGGGAGGLRLCVGCSAAEVCLKRRTKVLEA